MTQRRIYQDEYPYFVTFRAKDGYAFFNDSKHTRLLGRIIFKTCEIKCYEVLSYQMMPDHVHLLVNRHPQAQPAVVARQSRKANAGTAASVRSRGKETGDFNITELLHGIKSYYINELRKKHNIPYSIWQKRFYTCIVDSERYLENVIYYIKKNPIKAELPRKYHEMPYQYFNWDKIKELF
ncbi:transposase [Patescibacteria group bacterium]|nr:transposase [Patescibacteria group bacterium]MBU1891042.1 transposase [Patescibacteria group bacterium]